MRAEAVRTFRTHREEPQGGPGGREGPQGNQQDMLCTGQPGNMLCTAPTYPPHHHHTHWGMVQDNANPLAALLEKGDDMTCGWGTSLIE